jgi:hypothetical protein
LVLFLHKNFSQTRQVTPNSNTSPGPVLFFGLIIFFWFDPYLIASREERGDRMRAEPVEVLQRLMEAGLGREEGAREFVDHLKPRSGSRFSAIF